MGFLSFLQRSLQSLLRYPNIGKTTAAVLGFLEVPILEIIHLLDLRTELHFFTNMMKYFTKVYGSRVIPLEVSLEAIPSISPSEEILSIVRRASHLSLGYCYCRSRHQNCDNDVWTCIHVGIGESLSEIQKRLPGKSTTIDEVEKIIYESNRRGLVHQLITAPQDDYFYVICNCCPCCCVMLRASIEYGLGNTALASNFEVEHNPSLCINCGSCIDHCHFNTLKRGEDGLILELPSCVGCGLCVPKCQEGALQLVRRKKGLKPLL